MKRYTNAPEHSSLEELWEVQLELALKFKEVCEKHNLRYFLTGGALLGAVRLEGFIPWNDDVDFFMPREDYEMLKQIAVDEFASPFTLQTPKTCYDIYYGGHVRLRHDKTTCINPNDILSKCNHGIWIDIKPLDFYYNNLKKRNRQLEHIRMYQRLSYAKAYSKYKKIIEVSEFQWRIFTGIAKYLNKEFLVSKELKWRKACKESEELVCFDYNATRYNPKVFDKKLFNETSELSFQGHKFKVPKNYHSVLKIIYGPNYLTPPPITQRVPTCSDYFIDTQTSYKEYLSTVLRGSHCIEGDTLTYSKALEKRIVLYGTNIMIDNYLKNTSDQYYPEFIVTDKSDEWFAKIEGYDIEVGDFDKILKIPREDQVVIVCATDYHEHLKQLMKLGINEAYVFCGSRVDLVNQFGKNNILLCLNGFPVVYDI